MLDQTSAFVFENAEQGDRRYVWKKVESWGENPQNSCCKFVLDVVFYRHHDYRYYS